MNYLQMGIGSFVARIFVALIFLGAFTGQQPDHL